MIPIKVDTMPIIKCNRFWFLYHIWSKNYKFTSSTFWEINTLGGYNKSRGFTKISKLIIRGINYLVHKSTAFFFIYRGRFIWGCSLKVAFCRVRF